MPKPLRAVLLSGALTAESAVGAAAEVLDDDAIVEGAEKVQGSGIVRVQVAECLVRLDERFRVFGWP